VNRHLGGVCTHKHDFSFLLFLFKPHFDSPFFPSSGAELSDPPCVGHGFAVSSGATLLYIVFVFDFDSAQVFYLFPSPPQFKRTSAACPFFVFS